MREKFWELELDVLTREEWEALCDGCGRCCLHKLEDDDTGAISETNVACKLLDTGTARCMDYRHRKAFVPDCLRLTPRLVKEIAVAAQFLRLSPPRGRQAACRTGITCSPAAAMRWWRPGPAWPGAASARMLPGRWNTTLSTGRRLMLDWLRGDHRDPAVEVAGRTLPIAIRRHPRSRRLTMRLAARRQRIAR